MIIKIVAIVFALLHLYLSTYGVIGSVYFRIIHFTGAAILIYLVLINDQKVEWKKWLQWVLIVLTSMVGLYLALNFNTMIWRVSFPTTLDVIFAGIAFIIVLDITRKTVGWALPIITLTLVGYALLGHYIPGQYGHPGYALERVLMNNYVTLEGMFGTPLAIMARLIFIFILFGVTLEVSGAGNYFLNLAKAIAGRLVGGPAKMAVVASGFFGSMSGSAVANTVATGSLTIPLMKRTGYKPHVAAAIESAASTGGQMVPPIMGAAAFLIAEFTGTPYLTVVIASIIPAILYFATVYAFVHLEAKKYNISGLPKNEIPPLWQTFKTGYYYFIPVIVLISMFVMKYSVQFSAGISTLVLFGIMLIKNKGSFRPIMEALEQGSISAVKVSSAAICAGIVVGIVGLTGIGVKFTGLMMGLAGENLFLAILLVGLASFILGMGLPVVAAYIILVVVAGTGLEALGIPLLAAHLIVFWFSQLSNVTPPVALAAYAGAGVANADPFKTGMHACKIAIGLPIIPFMFAYRPMLVGISDASLPIILFHSGIVLIGLLAIIAGLQGYLITVCEKWKRLILFTLGFTLLFNILWLNLLSILGLILIVIYQKYQLNQEKNVISYY